MVSRRFASDVDRMIALADKAYVGAGERVLVPCKGRGKPEAILAPSSYAKQDEYAR
ncbi:hypothetical protein GCM10009677_28760 [Sphaerisporangium rubeum]|uniref:Uncharacterized protein n=1 Tax=Sphaerisporangium rubeum TaxID=321317 RepID=A0A7X0M7F4_9ACTN|nr:hypothetical protein [Sphaerisporangium rubeum]